MEPTVSDLRLTFVVFEINALEELDSFMGPTPEFRLTVTFEQLVPWTWIKLNNDGDSSRYFEGYNIQDDKTFKTDLIRSDALWIKITIALDELDFIEGGYLDDAERCDISPQADHESVTLFYDLRTSLWNELGTFKHVEDTTAPPESEIFLPYDEFKNFKFKEGSVINESGGTRYLGDIDDSGYVIGKHDGNSDDDCDVSFGIHLNDADKDNLTDYSERYYSFTDRSKWDHDGDKMSDGWEFVHSLHPRIKSQDNDNDEDGISDLNEYDLEEYGSHPHIKDIFVEVDWMAQSIYYHDEIPEYGTYDEGVITIEYKMSSRAQFLVIKAFAGHKTGLHIDDGCMGGGEVIKHTDTLSSSEFQDLIDGVYNTDEGFSGRTGFHYCVFADEIWTGRSGKNWDLEYVVADGNSYVNHKTKAQAGLFMHETGHSIGLSESDFGGIDNDDSQNSGDPDYEKYTNYKSCMNYRYTKTIIDYSDGNHGTPGVDDYDDWSDVKRSLGIYL